MGHHTEPLTGGLVTDRDPAQLKQGQISYVRNMVYKQNATSLRSAPGRAFMASAATASGGVYGLRELQFDNGMQYLLAAVEDMYRSYDINNGGSFSTIVNGLASGKTIETVQFRNRYYVLNGATANASSLGSNKVLYLSATATATPVSTRPHGMLPVIAAPAVATATSSTEYFTLSPATGYYEYWLTEVYKGTQDGAKFEIESAFSNETGPTTVPILTTQTIPTISVGGARNSSTTHWRVYRSPKKDRATDVKFPVGYLAGEFGASTAVTSFQDKTAYVSAVSAYATAFSSGAWYADFASASAMASADGVYASALDRGAYGVYSQGCYGFNFTMPKGVIMGIKVELKAYTSGSIPESLQVAIGVRDTTTGDFQTTLDNGKVVYLRRAARSTFINTYSAGAAQTITFGSETDGWLARGISPFTDEDFKNGKFMVVLTVFPNDTSVSPPPYTFQSTGVDYVKLTVYYGGGSDSQVVYPAVDYNFEGVQAQVGRNFPPPSAKTGDIINDQLVLNDQDNPSLIRYSYPGEPDYFPPSYFIDFETKSNDVVQCIRTVNNRVIVGLDNQLWRVNYLPSEKDASFDRGKAIDNISGQYGIVNPMCATTITIEGQSETLAFISNFGLHTTDGYNIITRSKNLQWAYSGRYATPIALLNDVENRCLRIYYRDEADPDRDLCLWASYDRSDIDGEGNFKFSGNVSMANYVSAGVYGKMQSVWTAMKSDGSSRFFMGYSSATSGGGGMVYQEDPTVNAPSLGYTKTYKYKTRRMFLNGISGEWMVDDLYGYCGSYSGNGELLTYTFEGTKTNATSPSTITKSITLQGQTVHRISPKIAVEGLTISCEMSFPLSVEYGQESIVIGSKSLGTEDSGL